jgi:hypothetical protein
MSANEIHLNRRKLIRYAASSAAIASVGGLSTWATTEPVISPDSPAYAYWNHRTKNELSDMEFLVMCATLAPSPHNTQPWLFKISGDRIDIFSDKDRHLKSADSNFRMMILAIGAAIENLNVAARQIGYRTTVSLSDNYEEFLSNGYCASVALRQQTPSPSPYFDAIFNRQTTRTAFDLSQPVNHQFLEKLRGQSIEFPGIGLEWIKKQAGRDPIAQIVRDSARSYLTDACHRDGMDWFRITRNQWETKGDGIAVFNGDAPAAIKRYVELLVSPDDLLQSAFKQGEIDSVDRLSAATPMWGVITTKVDSFQQKLLAGQMVERVYLEASMNGLAVQPQCYPTETADGIARLKSQLNLADGTEPLFVFRLGHSKHIAKSVRRNIKDVMVT